MVCLALKTRTEHQLNYRPSALESNARTAADGSQSAALVGSAAGLGRLALAEVYNDRLSWLWELLRV